MFRCYYSIFVYSCLLFVKHGEGDGKLSTLAQFALTFDFALMQVDDLLDIRQSQTEAFHIVFVARMHAVELLKNFFDILALDALSVVAYGEVQTVVIVPCADEDIDRLFGFAVFTMASTAMLVMSFLTISKGIGSPPAHVYFTAFLHAGQ